MNVISNTIVITVLSKPIKWGESIKIKDEP